MSVKATTTVSIFPALTSAASCSFVSKSSPRGLGVAAPSPRDDALEQRTRPWQVGGELLRMALESNDQAVVRLDVFHSPVIALGRLLPALGPGRQRSMVE